MMKKEIIILTLIIVLLGCSPRISQEEQQEIIAARLVKTTNVIQKDVMEYLQYSGQLESDKAINISPAISGEVTKIYVTEGEQIEKGFLMAMLDDTQFKQAEIQFNNIAKNYEKMSELYNSGVIDEGSFDEIAATYKNAKESYEFLLENTEIRAPFPGTVTDISLKEKEMYNSMATAYFIRLVNLDKIKGTVDLSETDIAKINVGDEVYFTTDSNPEKEFKGQITFVSPEADAYSGTYSCQFITDNKDNLLKHNQFCRAKLVTAKSVNTFSVPPSAILDNNEIMINSDGIAKKIHVETGLENENEIEIISGLKGDEEVVYVGNLGLEDGNKLQISK